MSTMDAPAFPWFLRRCVTVSALALGACSEPEPLCDICTTSAIVYGRVLRSGGTPFVGNAIAIEAHAERCDSSVIVGTSDAGLVTGSDGSYRTRLITGAAPFTGCPHVSVDLPGETPDHISVDGSTVEFLDDFGPNQHRDSVRVDIEVP